MKVLYPKRLCAYKRQYERNTARKRSSIQIFAYFYFIKRLSRIRNNWKRARFDEIHQILVGEGRSLRILDGP